MIAVRKIATITVFVLAACGSEDPNVVTVPGRWYTEAQVETGRMLYADYCAVCHLADGSAAADWRTRGADGHYPPPPLNGSAHTWHHALEMLDNTIANGGGEYGGVMPGFASVLDQEQRLSIVAHLQSWWTDETYGKWGEIDSRGR